MTSDGQRDDADTAADFNPDAVVVEAAGVEDTTSTTAAVVGAAVDSAPAAGEEGIQQAKAESCTGEAVADQEEQEQGGDDQAASPQSMKAPHISTLYDKQVGQSISLYGVLFYVAPPERPTQRVLPKPEPSFCLPPRHLPIYRICIFQ